MTTPVTPEAVGFVGVGTMGNPMAMNLLEAGHRLTIHDLSDRGAHNLLDAGARWAPSPADVAVVSDVVFLSLPNPADVRAVVTGARGVLTTARPGSTIVDLSTNSPTIVRSLALEAANCGVTFLDAPVSGGVVGARKGKLALMVGGDEQEFQRHQPLLRVLGDRVFYVGGPGAGSVAKLVNNMLFFHGLLGSLEALVLAGKAGVDLHVLRDVVRAGSGASVAWDHAANAVLKDRMAPNFTVALAAKDAALTVLLANELNVQTPSSTHVRDLLARYRDDGLGAEDVVAIVTALERAADIVVRGGTPLTEATT